MPVQAAPQAVRLVIEQEYGEAKEFSLSLGRMVETDPTGRFQGGKRDILTTHRRAQGMSIK